MFGILISAWLWYTSFFGQAIQNEAPDLPG